MGLDFFGHVLVSWLSSASNDRLSLQVTFTEASKHHRFLLLLVQPQLLMSTPKDAFTDIRNVSMAPPRNLKILALGKPPCGCVIQPRMDEADNRIDGGGIRGLSSLEILKRVMYRVGQAMEPPVPDLQPWQYFDLIGGTSVGILDPYCTLELTDR